MGKIFLHGIHRLGKNNHHGSVHGNLESFVPFFTSTNHVLNYKQATVWDICDEPTVYVLLVLSSFCIDLVILLLINVTC